MQVKNDEIIYTCRFSTQSDEPYIKKINSNVLDNTLVIHTDLDTI